MKGAVLAAALITVLAGSVFASDEALHYRGEVSLYQDTVWQGEVLIDGILTVAPGATLEIRPGTVVRFTRFDSNGDGIGEHEIFVQGRFLAAGTADKPILFTSAQADPRPADWGAINMMASEGEGNLLEHCTVEYGYRGFHAHFSRARLMESTFRYNTRGLQFQESTVEIRRCRVTGNGNGMQFRDSDVVIADTAIADNYWGLRCVYSDVDLHGCRIEANLINGANLRDSTCRITGNRIARNRKGLYLQRSRGEVRHNVLIGNSEHGILLERWEGEVAANLVAGNGRAGLKWIDSTATVRRNRLEDNGEYAIVNDGSTPTDARGNWWGTTAPERIDAAVLDGADRPGLGRVDWGEPLPQPPDLPLLPLLTTEPVNALERPF